MALLGHSTLSDPLTDEELDKANADERDFWIHVRCKKCGDVECCFNHTAVALERTCFPCLMGWEHTAWRQHKSLQPIW